MILDLRWISPASGNESTGFEEGGTSVLDLRWIHAPSDTESPPETCAVIAAGEFSGLNVPPDILDFIARLDQGIST